MSNAELVTVLLSTYEGAKWLPDLLDSVREQSRVELRVLARDDGSSDLSHRVLMDWAAADERVTVLPLGRRLGAAGSFMHLLSLVETPYFAFCDQDDVWFPHKLSWAIDGLQRRGGSVSAIAADAEVVDQYLRLVHPSAIAYFGMNPSPTLGQLLVNNGAIGSTLVGTFGLARRAVELAGGRRVAMHDWWCALVAKVSDGLVIDPVPTMRWRRHAEAATGAPLSGLSDRLARRRAYLADAAKMADYLLEGTVRLDVAERRTLEAMATTDVAGLGVADFGRLLRAGAVPASIRGRAIFAMACVDRSARVEFALGDTE